MRVASKNVAENDRAGIWLQWAGDGAARPEAV
jgi:hypothetical protein